MKLTNEKEAIQARCNRQGIKKINMGNQCCNPTRSHPHRALALVALCGLLSEPSYSVLDTNLEGRGLDAGKLFGHEPVGVTESVPLSSCEVDSRFPALFVEVVTKCDGVFHSLFFSGRACSPAFTKAQTPKKLIAEHGASKGRDKHPASEGVWRDVCLCRAQVCDSTFNNFFSVSEQAGEQALPEKKRIDENHRYKESESKNMAADGDETDRDTAVKRPVGQRVSKSELADSP